MGYIIVQKKNGEVNAFCTQQKQEKIYNRTPKTGGEASKMEIENLVFSPFSRQFILSFPKMKSPFFSTVAF